MKFTPNSRAEVMATTVLGTAICIGVAFIVDGFSFRTGRVAWGKDPINNLIIPLILAPPIIYTLSSKVRQLAEMHRKLAATAERDYLTGVLNRGFFTARVTEQLRSTGGALLLIDADDFKRVNDTFGHDEGDEALKLIARAIAEAVGRNGIVGRFGGEEFGVFLPDTSAPAALGVAHRVLAAVRAARFAPRGEAYPLSVSIGCGHADVDEDFRSLYRAADAHLYGAKRRGKNTVAADRARPAA